MYFGLFKHLGWPEFGIYLGGFVAAFAVAYLVIGGLLELISRASLRYFAYYCWARGLSSIALLLGKP